LKKVCKIHKIEYQQYSTLTPCPLCLKEKLNDKNISRRTNKTVRVIPQVNRLHGKGENTFSKFVRVGPGKSPSRKNGRIKETARHKEEARELTKIKSEKICRLGMVCESCGKNQIQVDLSHFIPGSKGLEYKLVPEASCLSCRVCHITYEHLKYQEIAKFKNLHVILDFLETRSYGRYLKITEGINKIVD
jgi:hypothetical protein